MHYSKLKHSVSQNGLLVDHLIHKEMKLIVSNDDAYFVFVDYIYKVLLPFLRDPDVLRCKNKLCKEPVLSGHDQTLYSTHFPPSGVVPFHGFSMYVSPLCYLYDDPVELYIVFRELYIRYFHKLHTITDNEESILSLCITFERILLEKEPRLVLHLMSIGSPPLQIAFRWLLRGFSGYLAVEQVLLLWDRVLAWDSIEILASESHFANLMCNNTLCNVKSSVDPIDLNMYEMMG
ncbi:TBC1 domain-containing protein [Echinococcus granulosus]|uniref:TBC1 domain-containing protein n=1 Tax=Echinococcus granulosus TaxID=6210 RepID=W6V080_ECHGR|nr:TBC1 domain-containing protein [Echinococcus granulosus]EUB64252.1 TBC1 domain-containing protein [Echinococcus granulosus]